MKYAFMLLASFLIVSCSSTKITSSWAKPDMPSNQFSNFLVMAVVGNSNTGLQQQMEENVAAELRRRGYKATSFFTQYGPKALENVDEQTALNQVAKSGADAILTIVMLDTTKEHYYTPGRVDYYPVGYYHRFWGYYGTTYSRIYTPGYYTTNTRYFWETNLYRTRDQELVYSVRTQSFDPTTSSNVAESYGENIVKDMAKHGIISRR